jgi:hypothetical protein
VADSLFTSQTPVVDDGDDGTDYTLGTALRRSTSGNIVRGRWYFPTPVPTGTTEWVLYSAAGAELHREAFVTPVAGQWNVTPEFTPIAYTADDLIVVSVYTSGMYVATVGFFTGGGDLVNGDITAPAADNGRLGNTDEYPSQEVDLCFFVDLVFEADAPASVAPSGIAVPVALGTPAASQALVALPTGLAIPVAAGTPAVAQTLTASPVGVAVPVAVGTPAVAQALTAAPAGLPLGVALGEPTLTLPGVTPAGVSVPVALGSPTVTWSAIVQPTGVAVPLALGPPRLPGGTVQRPDTGTITRPFTGIIARP